MSAKGIFGMQQMVLITQSSLVAGAAASVSPASPSSVNAGDLILIFVGNTGAITVTPPGGWSAGDIGTNIRCFFKNYAPGDFPVVFTGGASNTATVMLCLRNNQPSSYKAAGVLDTWSTASVGPTGSITTSVPNSTVFSVFMAPNNASSVTWSVTPAGITAVSNTSPTTTVNGLLICSEIVNTPATTTGRTATLSASLAVSYSRAYAFAGMS